MAAALRGKSVSPNVQMTVTPGSRQILDTIVASGVYQDMMQAGARMLEPICGPCVGIGQAPLKGAPSLRTFNRNFPGRSGTAEDQVYLCSPSTAAASALTGKITDPRELGPLKLRPAADPDPRTAAVHITKVLPLPERRNVEVDRGENLAPPPRPSEIPQDLQAKVLIVVGDDISTGDMTPDGAIAMSTWSNIAACAQFMFRRIDPGFHARAIEWDGGIIVAGDNYGQGSSREHAALSPLHLGVRVLAARSYARIHRRNLISVGIVPLLLPESFAADEVGIGTTWKIDGLAASVSNGQTTVLAHVDGGEPLILRMDLSPTERAVLSAGGLLAQVIAGQRIALNAPTRPA